MVWFVATETVRSGGRHGLRVASVALLIAASFMVAFPALAEPGTQVAIVLDVPFDGSPESTLVSSVPGCPTATATTSLEHFAATGNIARFSGTKEFDCGSSGTFTVSFKAHTLVCSPTDSGTWKVVGGTGMYVGMTGQGQVRGTYYGEDPCEHDGVIDTYEGIVRLSSG